METLALEKERPPAATGGQGTEDTPTVPPAGAEGNMFQQAAAAYLARGWQPIPVEPRGKRPMAQDWPNQRLTAEQARAVWAVDPPPNIGILCGEPSRIVVLDFDDPAAFGQWFARHREAGAGTYAVARDNAGGGRGHLYFALAEGQAAPPSRKGPGWDLLSTGRQVVAPPSVHPSGGRYRVVQELPPASWSDEYVPEAPAPAAPRPAPAGQPHPYAQAALEAECNAVAFAPEGTRNDRLNTAALKLGQFVGAGALPIADVEGALLAAARTAGLPEGEALATIRSGLSKGMTEPRTVPRREPAGADRQTIITAPALSEDAPEPWEAPAPLGAVGGEPPPWPWDCLPSVLRNMGEAVAQTTGAPECMAGACVLGCASVALGNRALLTIKHGHEIRGNLYFLVAAPVGCGKTPCLAPLRAPMHDWEAARLPGYERELAEWKAASMIFEARRTALKREAAKKNADLDAIRGVLARLEMEAGKEPAEPRLFTEDCTSEALGRLLVANGEAMGVISSEGRKALQIARGRYVEGGDLDLWLGGHAGDAKRVHRAGRAPYEIHSPCLSALLLTQPDALQSVGEDPEAAASGFLARFLYVVPGPATGGEYVRGVISEPASRDYRNAMMAVLNLPQEKPIRATLAPEALDLFSDHYRELGRELQAAATSGRMFQAEWAGKAREAVARLALLFAVFDSTDRATGPVCVTLDDMDAAGRLVKHLANHAARAGEVIGMNPEIVKARRVWAWLAGARARLREYREKEGCGAIMAAKVRDLLQAGVAGCDTPEAATAIMKALEARGYLQHVLWRKPGVAARPHDLWYVNPKDPAAC